MQYFKSDSKPQTPLSWVALLRVLLGLMFLTTWWSNMDKGFYTADGLYAFFMEVFPQSQNSLTWYGTFIESVILPMRSAFAPFQLVTEFLIGLFLLVGFFTPLTSLAAGFFIVNTFLATYGHDWPWSYALILGVLFIVLVTRAGRSLGIDAWLMNRRGEPSFFLWR